MPAAVHRVVLFRMLVKESRLVDGWLFRRLGDTLLSTITSSICSLEEAKGSAKIIPLVLQCLSESHDDFASFVGRHIEFLLDLKLYEIYTRNRTRSALTILSSLQASGLR